MPTTGAPGNIWYPDANSPVAPLENLFLQQATSVNIAIDAVTNADSGNITISESALFDSNAEVRKIGKDTKAGGGEFKPKASGTIGGSLVTMGSIPSDLAPEVTIFFIPGNTISAVLDGRIGTDGAIQIRYLGGGTVSYTTSSQISIGGLSWWSD